MGWEIFYAVILLLTGIGVFMVGIIKFSNLLQSGSNQKISVYFQKMGNNRIVGFGVGAAATTVIQSSTATTVIIVGLVNSGVMLFGQSVAVIFGANVGTAVSSILLSLSAFRIKYFFMLLTFVGAFTKLLTKNQRVGKICDVLIAFGIVFVGLELMSMAFRGNQYLVRGFESAISATSFPLLLILLGFLLTAIIQSSTAAAAIFITLAINIELPFTAIMYLIIGSYLGTTITTLIASIGASRNAKRAAMVHLLFNVFAAILFLPILWPLQGPISDFVTRGIPNPVWQITVFGLVYKFTAAIVLLSFIKPMTKLVYLIIKDKPEQITIEEIKSKDDHEMFHGFTDKF
ncbi:MAG: Na/Pi symporter [Firmicutes bacterium]|nr:Na/Pi symporter [Bacillota bacterium]